MKTRPWQTLTPLVVAGAVLCSLLLQYMGRHYWKMPQRTVALGVIGIWYGWIFVTGLVPLVAVLLLWRSQPLHGSVERARKELLTEFGVAISLLAGAQVAAEADWQVGGVSHLPEVLAALAVLAGVTFVVRATLLARENGDPAGPG